MIYIEYLYDHFPSSSIIVYNISATLEKEYSFSKKSIVY